MAKRLFIVVGVLALIGVAVGGWAAWTFRSAEQHLQEARADLLDAQTALESFDAKAAQASVAAAQEQSEAAARLTNRWVWRGVAAVPVLGDSADAASAVVLAANSAVTALSGITDGIAQLDLKSLVDKGRVDLAAVATAGEVAQTSQEPLEQAEAYLDRAPTASSGAWVIKPIENAHAELSANLSELSSTADVLMQSGRVLPGALGAEGPKKYFVAIQAPNETRGTGGLLGTWAVVKADNGKLSVVDSGANEDLPDLAKLPAGMGAGYKYRYGDDPTLVANMNMSPDFPSAAKLWLASWQKKSGDRLDGAVSLDVTAVGQLLAATGTTLTAPDGMSLDGADFANFALLGIYDKFPSMSQNAERRAYQDVLGRQATKALLELGSPDAILRALSGQVDRRGVAIWLADDAAQEVIADSPLGQSLQPVKPHTVEPVLINVGWSKLDTYIDRTVKYTVGRCPSQTDQVRSEVTTSLTSDIPPGTVLPEYVVGTVPDGPAGPVNKLFLQVHLPEGAEVVEVFVDGNSAGWLPFEEAGRPAVGIDVSLPPREVHEIKVQFDEAADGGPGSVLVQPMARDAQIEVRDRTC